MGGLVEQISSVELSARADDGGPEFLLTLVGGLTGDRHTFMLHAPTANALMAQLAALGVD